MGEDKWLQLSPTEQKHDAVAALRTIVESAVRDDRELDAWEMKAVISGICALFAGFYTLALVDAQLALTPIAERSPQFKPLPADLQRLTRGELLKHLAEADAMPIRDFRRTPTWKA